MAPIVIQTSRGPARATVEHPTDRRAGLGLVLGHGAGGGVAAPDLQTAAAVALRLGMSVTLVEQPYRVAGRRAPAPAAHLDDAWTEAVSRLGQDEEALAGMALVTGGRSMGARVACRTAGATRAIAVLCLAFPLQPPARAGAPRTPASRQAELDAVTVPALVVQGVRDRFGMPSARPGLTVAQVPGDHALKADLRSVGEVIDAWLTRLIGTQAE